MKPMDAILFAGAALLVVYLIMSRRVAASSAPGLAGAVWKDVQ